MAYFYMEGKFCYPIEGKGINLKEVLMALLADEETYEDKVTPAAAAATPPTPPAPEKLTRAEQEENDAIIEYYSNGLTKDEMEGKVRRFSEFMDDVEKDFPVVDAGNPQTTWEFKRSVVVGKSLSNICDEPRRKNKKGIFSNSGIIKYVKDNEMTNGLKTSIYSKGHYFPTQQVWDRATGWLMGENIRSVNEIAHLKKHKQNSLTQAEWDMRKEPDRTRHRVDDPASGARLLNSRKKNRIDNVVNMSAKKKQKTVEAAEVAKRTVETERAVLARYEFDEGFLTDDHKRFLEQFRDKKEEIVVSEGFKQTIGLLNDNKEGDSEGESDKAIQNDMFCLALVLLHEVGYLEYAVDQGGNFCAVVGSVLKHAYDKSQTKKPAQS